MRGIIAVGLFSRRPPVGQRVVIDPSSAPIEQGVGIDLSDFSIVIDVNEEDAIFPPTEDKHSTKTNKKQARGVAGSELARAQERNRVLDRRLAREQSSNEDLNMRLVDMQESLTLERLNVATISMELAEMQGSLSEERSTNRLLDLKVVDMQNRLQFALSKNGGLNAAMRAMRGAFGLERSRFEKIHTEMQEELDLELSRPERIYFEKADADRNKLQLDRMESANEQLILKLQCSQNKISRLEGLSSQLNGGEAGKSQEFP